jgi:hypothetical protein
VSVARVLKTVGLWTSPSYASAPAGAYAVLDNVVCNYPDVLESRRGFEWLPYTFGASAAQGADNCFSFKGTLLVQAGSALYYSSGVAFVDVGGTNSPPDPTVLRMKGEETGLSFYYTTSDGVKVLDAVGNTPRAAGLPAGPYCTTVSSATKLDGDPDEGWLPEDSQTAYCATWLWSDANEVEHESTPSNAFYVINPPSFTVPAGDAARPGLPFFPSRTFIQYTYPGHGLSVGDVVNVTFNAADVNYASGDHTVLEATYNTFVTKGGAAGPAPDVTTQPCTVTTGTKNVSVSVDIPQTAVDGGYQLLVYRAKASAAATASPRAQFYLTKATQPSVAGVYTFVDSTPDTLLQDPLYTNTDDGEPPDGSLQNDNSQPPYCTDVAVFDSRLWGANYQDLQTFNLSLLGCGSPNGLQTGDTITIGGITYTAGTDFPLYQRAYTPKPVELLTAAENIALTAQALALTITNNAASDVECFYTSGPNDFPGQMLLRSRVPGGAAFSVSVSRASAWSPVFTGTLTSVSNTATNGLWFSKQNQPSAVPLLNRLTIGPSNCRILRIRALRDKLFVFTDIAGIYTVSSVYPYNVTLLSVTAVLLAPDSLVNFDDTLYALTTQGVVKVNEAGPTIISVPIEQDIKALFGVGLPTLRVKAFGIGYESYRKYLLAMPTDPSDTENTQAFVYDAATRTWTRWTRAFSAGVVVPQVDYLYVGTPGLNKVSVERKNFNRTDYSDESWTVTLNSFSGVTANVTSTTEPQVGDLLYQGALARALITAVDETTPGVYSLTTDDTVAWSLGVTTTVFPAIDNTVLSLPMAMGEPESKKNVREVSYHFRTPGFKMGNGLFRTDLNPELREVPFSLGGFGQVNWGAFAWTQNAVARNRRVSVPAYQRRASFFNIGFGLRESQAQWQLVGMTPVFEGMSERNSK